MQKIILYYKFSPVADPEMTRRWQQELATRLNLRGRIIVARHGINGTLGGDLEDLRAYKRAMNDVKEWRGIEYKWSEGSRENFPKLSVKVRPELVTLEAGEFDVYDSSTALSPKDWHQYLTDRPNTLVLDARNDYESQVGYFAAKNLVRPQINTFKEIKTVIKDLPKDQPILTYCTGDVRCEYLSAYMQSVGFSQVYHLAGGIVKYGQAFGDKGYWRGQCYVFDSRLGIKFSDQAIDVANCLSCQQKTSSQINCDECNQQVVVCQPCQQATWEHCSNDTKT